MDPSRQTPAPPEKDSYSYDEMMARLRRQRSSGGRRVEIEAEDGTVEVKKRKRRTKQPKKQLEQRIVHLRKTVMLIAIPLVLILIGAYLSLKARYQSEAFRSSLSKRTSELLNARAEVATIEVKGLSVTTRRLLVEPSNSFLRDAELTTLSGSLTAGSLFSSDWHLTSAAALHAHFHFQPPRPPLSQSAEHPSAATPRLTTAGFGLSSRPGAINIGRLLINSADFIWTSKPKGYVFLEDATLVSDGAIGSSTSLNLSNAKLRLPGWPAFDVESADLKFSPSRIRIENGVLSHNYIAHLGGDAAVNGQIDLARGQALAHFVSEFDSMPVESLVRNEFKGKVDGDVDATLTFTADLSNLRSLKVEGPFRIRKGSFGDITPSKRLAAFLAEPRISRIPFHSIKGRILLDAGTMTVEALDATSPDLAHVTGSYSIEPDGILSGTLKVGIAEKILAKIPGGRKTTLAIFGETNPATGISYAVVKLSGTSTSPLEDLTARIEAALEQYEIESAAPPASSYPTIPLSPDAKKSKTSDPAKKKAEENFEKLLEQP